MQWKVLVSSQRWDGDIRHVGHDELESEDEVRRDTVDGERNSTYTYHDSKNMHDQIVSLSGNNGRREGPCMGAAIAKDTHITKQQ